MSWIYSPAQVWLLCTSAECDNSVHWETVAFIASQLSPLPGSTSVHMLSPSHLVHAPYMEAPDEYNRILLDFLRGELPTGIIIDTPSPKMGEKTILTWRWKRKRNILKRRWERKKQYWNEDGKGNILKRRRERKAILKQRWERETIYWNEDEKEKTILERKWETKNNILKRRW